ncbi:MAG: bifunctional metallophosphatase/5'-nucleotidase [Candidatus Heimdallarchaeaceae archaeon]
MVSPSLIAGSSNQQNNVEKQLFIRSKEPYQPLDLNSETVNLTILHINDWHGWLEPHDGRGGAATYMGYFIQEGYNSSDDSFLLLSGGDENTGPAVATLSKGEAMVDVMNAMNFTASAIGNHEFDYGIEWLSYRQNISNFPMLSCNIFDKGTTHLANFTIPWIVEEHTGVQVGIVGLTTTATYTAAHPKYTQYYDFGDYEAALRNNIPAMRAAGAEVIIALTHITPSNLVDLALDVADLGIDVFLGGHGGTPTVTKVEDSIIAMAGHKAAQYVRIDLKINTTLPSAEVIASSGVLKDNVEGGVTPVAEIQQLVDYWVDLVGAEEVISYASFDIYDTYPESGIGNIVTDGMMDYFDWGYDFAISNRGGGIRDYFRAGNITVGDVVSVIPFENEILEITLTGQQILDLLATGHGQQVYSGIRYNFSTNPNFHVTSATINISSGFEPIKTENSYTGIMIDYLWWVAYKDEFPSTPTGIYYRDTVIKYIRKMSDISQIAYDGRIQEEVVAISEYQKPLLVILFVAISITMKYIRNKKRR